MHLIRFLRPAWKCRIALLVVSLSGGIAPAAAQTCPSTDGGSDFTYVYPGSNPGDLNAGESLLILSGTYTGNLNGPASGALVCVNPGATFQPGAMNNMAGTVQNHGTTVLTGVNFNAGAAFDNRAGGDFTFSNTNANGAISITNAVDATMHATGGNVTIPSGSTVVNDGDVDVLAGTDLDIQGNSTVTNNGNIDLNGDNVNLAGNVTNTGFIHDVGQFQINGGGSFTNGCSVVASAQITNSGTLVNQGFMMVTGGTGFLVNHGTMTQEPGAVMSGVNFVNNGSVGGGGRYYFTLVTQNQGPFNGADPSDPIVFYDVSRNPPPEFFDLQTQAPTNTVRISFDPPTEAEALADCSPDFPSPPEADVSVTKTTPVDALRPGAAVTYTLTAANGGPDGAEGSMLTDQPDDGLTCTVVACTGASGGASCPVSGTGTGQLSIGNLLGSGVALDLPAGGQLVFELTCTVDAAP